MRIETDFLGQRRIPDDVYYGVQTLRGKENFVITGVGISAEPRLVIALAYVKKACAMANRDLGLLDPAIAGAIVNACDRLVAGEFLDQFVIDFIQGGAGTSTNMNANEVIANLALEILGEKKGNYAVVNPNDHVNFGQSTNDVYPTAFRLALVLRLNFAFLGFLGLPWLKTPRRAAAFGAGAALPLALQWWRNRRILAAHDWVFTWDGLATPTDGFGPLSTLVIQMHPDVALALRRLHEQIVPWPEFDAHKNDHSGPPPGLPPPLLQGISGVSGITPTSHTAPSAPSSLLG